MGIGSQNGDGSDLSDGLTHENAGQRRPTGEMTREEPLVATETPDPPCRDPWCQLENFVHEQERRAMREEFFRTRQRGHFLIAFKRLAGVSLGEILYQTSCNLPFSSMRKADRSMPMYLRPYMLFSFQTP